MVLKEGDMKTKKKLLLICLVAMLGISSLFINYATPAEQWVYVGQLADMTGPAAPELIPISRGTDIYFQDLNKKGGIKGIKVGMEWVDTKYRLPDALSGYERLKEKTIVFCLAMSHAASALKEKFAEDKVPAAYNSQATVPYWPPGWIYGVGPSFADDLAFLANFLLENWKEKRAMRIALMFSDDTFGRSIYDGAVQYLKEKRMEIVTEEPLHVRATDATSQLLRVKAANPDYIMCNFMGANQAIVLKDRYKLGIKIPVLVCHGSWAEDLLKMAGAEACEGVITARPWGLTTDDKWGIKLGNRLIEQYLPEWARKPGGVYVGVGTGLVIGEAIRLTLEKVGSDKLSGATLKEFGFDQIKGFDTGGLVPEITYLPTDHRGGRSERLIKISEGKPIIIKDWTETPVMKPIKK
jgi:branched-chain amino acid transport system substrate-binding protein